MARMIFRPAHRFNYDSATRQLDTGDLDHILDTESDIGYAFSLVVAAAIEAGLENFSENFIAENDLLTQAQADALYELVGAVLAHVAELDPHTQYVTGDELTTALAGIDLSAYYTKIEADALFEAIGVAASAISSHEAASDPHTGYQLESEKGAANGYAPLDASSDLPLTHLPDHTHVDSSSGGTISVFPTRATATKTTGSLANGAVETGTIALAAGYRLMRFEADRACRVRIYKTSTARTNDANRPIGTDVNINSDHGLVFEFIATGAIDAMLSPFVDGACPTGTDVYYSIENRSGGTSTVSIELDWLRSE